MFATSLSDWPRKLDAGLDTEPLDAKKGESRKRHGTHISGKRKIISGQFPDTPRISGQFPDNFWTISGSGGFRRMPADSGGREIAFYSCFIAFPKFRVGDSGGFRRIPADNQKSARNQTRNTTRNQKLSRNYFLNGFCQQTVSESHPDWIPDSRDILAQRLLSVFRETCPKQGVSRWQSTWSNFALSNVFGCFWQRIPWRRHFCCQIHSIMKFSDGIPCQACKKWLCGQIFSFWADL